MPIKPIVIVAALTFAPVSIATEGCPAPTYEVAKKSVAESMEYLTCNNPLSGFCWSLFNLTQPTEAQVQKVNEYLTKLKGYEALTKLGGSYILTEADKLDAIIGLQQGLWKLVEGLKKIENNTERTKPASGEEAFNNATSDAFVILDAKFAEFDARIAKQTKIKEAMSGFKASMDKILSLAVSNQRSDKYPSTYGFKKQGDIWVKDPSENSYSTPVVIARGAVTIYGPKDFIKMSAGRRLATIRDTLLSLGEQERITTEQVKIFVDAITKIVATAGTLASSEISSKQSRTETHYDSTGQGYKYPDKVREAPESSVNIDIFLSSHKEISPLIEKLETLLKTIEAQNPAQQ